MIVRALDAALRLVTQPDHAAFAADLLQLLRLPGLVEHPRRAALLRAVRLHDNGWQELDAAPMVDRASGQPYTFLDLPDARRLEVWRRGTMRMVESDPYVALLAGEHALALSARRAGWRELRTDIEERRPALLERCGVRGGDLLADYRFLDLADRLSLVVCNGWREHFDHHGVRGELRGEELALAAPFPLAGATTFTLSCRHVPARRYDGDADLAVTLAAARWEQVPVRVVPL